MTPDRSIDGPRRIGMNLLWLVPGEVGGSEEYTIGLLRALEALAPDDIDLVLYVNSRTERDHPELVAGFETVVAPISGTSRPLRVLVESTWLAWRSRRDRVEAVHHGGGTMPVLRSRPGLVTLHDLQPISHPERFGAIKRTYIRLAVPRSLRRASRVVCLSDFTAGDAVVLAGVDPSRVAIVPSGVDPVDLIESGPSQQERSEVLARFGLSDTRFLLLPAITYTHKNHRTLVDAFARLGSTHPDLCLVLTGGPGDAEEALLQQIQELALGERVLRTGRVAAPDLDILYREAALVAFPSLYEGFGLPLLEAMVRGCPVVASSVGGLPQVGGEAARFVDPLDVEGWVDAIRTVLDDDGYRSTMVAAGLEQSHRFRWSSSAVALAELYRGLPRN